MKLSILIPVGSIHEFFIEALESVINDAPSDSEILICAERQILESAKAETKKYFKDSRIKFVVSESGDIVTNLNTGLAVAKGEFVARMDSDDLLVRGRFSKQITYLDNDTNVQVVGSYLQYICPHDVNKGIQDYPRVIKRGFLGLVSPKVAHPSVMMRRKFVSDIGMYSANYPHVEDLELWLRVLRKSDIHNIPEALLKYRLHPGQISRARSDEQLKYSLLAFINDALTFCNRDEIDTTKFEDVSLETFFLSRKSMVSGLGVIRRAIFMVMFQEKYLERYCLTYLHSKSPAYLIRDFLLLKTDKTVSKKIRKNLIGFFMILIKITLRRAKASMTLAGRKISDLRTRGTSTCKKCS